MVCILRNRNVCTIATIPSFPENFNNNKTAAIGQRKQEPMA